MLRPTGFNLDVDGRGRLSNVTLADITEALKYLVEHPDSFVLLDDPNQKRFFQVIFCDNAYYHAQYRDGPSGLLGTDLPSVSEVLLAFEMFAKADGILSHRWTWDLVLDHRGVPMSQPGVAW